MRVIPILRFIYFPIANRGHVALATVENWDRHFDVNVKGVFFCYKHAGVQMVAQGRGGRIIGAASVSGKRGL